MTFRTFILISLISLQFSGSCIGQNSSSPQQPATSNTGLTGGPFENGEYYLMGMPTQIASVDTSSGWFQNGTKLLVTGTIFQIDGKTPAPGIILYYYQTDVNGKYIHKSGETRSMPPNTLGQTHGSIRGWIKTDKNGKYSIYTIRPGVYPTRDEPAHIHLTIKEPGIPNSYYIDDLVFDDDELLTTSKRRTLENRGGSGILRPLISGSQEITEHDIVLGLNIPNYSAGTALPNYSGLNIGEDQPSFIPYHAFGPDKGSKACPVCKYGRYHGIVYFVGNKPNWNEIKKWLSFLDEESSKRQKYLKAYFVYGDENDFNHKDRHSFLEKIGQELDLKHLALTFVPSFSDKETEAYLNKINKGVENTFIIYKNRSIVDKYVNLKPSGNSFKLISSSLDATRGDYFELPEANHK